MKRIVLIFVVFIMVALVAVLCACTQNQEASLSDECLRIHIRANSNSTEDQTVKLKVRDELTAFFTIKLELCKNKEQAYEALQNAMPEIKQIAEQTLLENDFDYGVNVTLAQEHFPDREYDNLVFPEGEYDALVVGLGTATGDNWWCVAFPPLCFVPNGDGEDIVYKSWVKELIDKIFN